MWDPIYRIALDRTAITLMYILSLVLLCSLLTLFVKAYRKYLTKAVMLAVGLFAALVVMDLLISWDIVVTLNRPEKGILIDIRPFDFILVHSLNWHLLGMVVLITGTLILTRKTKKSFAFWIFLAAAAVLMCGFCIMAYYALKDYPEEYLHSTIWWL